jgi:RNA polymerase sigma-70 factor (ECF subfamily)
MDVLALPAPAAGAAFAGFFTATWPHLAGYCVALVRDEVLAEEIAQEAMTRLYARLPVVRDPRAYVFRVATNVAREHWRAASRTSPVGSFAGFDQPVSAGVDEMLPVVLSLPPALRDVVLLHYYADLRVEDVAHAVRRPVGTVKRRLHEARAHLARAVEGTR